MDIFLQILIGAVLAALGVLAVKYTFWLTNLTGNLGFAERYLGAGGTYSFYKLAGVVLAIFGLMYATGLGTPVLEWLLSPLAQFFPKNR
jgi:hypothetical protein